MSAQPVGVYALTIPADGSLVPALPHGVPAGLRITMAAIDPTETPTDVVDANSKPMATLKIVRLADDESDEDEDDYEDIDSDEEEDSDEDMEDVNGGPSDPKKAKVSKKQALQALAAADLEEDDESEEDSADEAEAQAVLAKLQQEFKAAKGKGKAVAEEDDSDNEGSDETVGDDEHVVCTLLPTSIPQQPLDLTISEGESIYFRVIGNHTVSLTGNYILPAEPADGDIEEDSDEELDELDGLDDLLMDGEEDSEEDELDDLADPRVTEIVEEEVVVKPAKGAKAEKGKNKRPAEDSDEDEPALDDLISKSLKTDPVEAEPTTNGETKKLSKAEKKRLKKQKNNEGAAVDAPVVPETNGKDPKKVQFAKNLEQGPTPSPAAKPAAAEAKPAETPSSVRTVQGIVIDDRKVGTGPPAKKGSNLSMRYIGKLESNGKQFDANKTGKPFSFKLGKGEVIKGWEIGLEGMQNGGERRITIPAGLAYGKKGAPPDIPPNATLRFDVKCVGVK